MCVCVCVCDRERERYRDRDRNRDRVYIYRERYIETVIEQKINNEERSTPLIFLLPRHPVYFSAILPNI